MCRCIATLVVAVVLFNLGIHASKLTNDSISRLWKLGFGTVTSESLIRFNLPKINGSLIWMVLIVNLPQALLSFLYSTYNGLFSCMLLMDEWNGFAHDRKTLRVTSAHGMQRSSYWLQVPYIYGIPLLVLSGTMHWLVSQSIFLALVTVFDHDNQEVLGGSISTCGYSCIAIFSVIILGSIVVLLGLLNGSRKYEGMPLVGSCSAAISAACHPPKEDVNAAYLPVLWGAVDVKGEEVGHCCFTSFDVSPPVKGRAYA